MMKVKRLRVVHHPYQVVGNISPWNFPLILSFDDSIAALWRVPPWSSNRRSSPR